MPAASAVLSPGTYLRKCRKRAGLSLDDVALRMGTIPAWPMHTRAEWLATIEADIAPISVSTAIALFDVIPFDAQVFEALMAIHAGATGIEPPLVCRVCACSQMDPCIDHAADAFCAWYDADHTLCTVCVGEGVAASAAPLIDPAQALATLPVEVMSASTTAMLVRLGLLNTPIGREELAEILTARGWVRDQLGFWIRPRAEAQAA
jgi:hypothetical protein